MSIIPLISRLPTAEQRQWISQLEEVLPEEKFSLANDIAVSERHNIEIAIVANPDAEVLKSFTGLKWVHSLWAGVENLIQLGQKQHFQLVRLTDPELANTMAEAVLTWTLYLHRKCPTYQLQQQEKVWQAHDYSPASNCSVAILGLGALGKTSALRLEANGFKVSGWSQSQKNIPNIECFYGQKGLDSLLNNCDILVCLLPLTKQTRGLIDKQLLAKLPHRASVINFSRGPLVATDALISALDSERLYHAVLDVFEQEPLPFESNLWNHKNITILPHIAASTNIESAVKQVAKAICYYRVHGVLESFVDLHKGF